MWDEPTVLEHIEADRIEYLSYDPPQQAEARRDYFIAQHISRLHTRDHRRFEEAGFRAQTLEGHLVGSLCDTAAGFFWGLHPILTAEILHGLEFLADIVLYTFDAHFIDGADRIPPCVAGKSCFFHRTRPSDWLINDAAGCTGETHTATPSSSSTEVQAAPRLDSLEIQHAEELARAQQRAIDRADRVL